MGVEDLARLIDVADGESGRGLPPREAVEQLARAGKADQLVVLLAAQELRALHTRVLQWQEGGSCEQLPLTAEDVSLLRARGRGMGLCASVPIPAYLAETYRGFLLWYGRAVARSQPSGNHQTPELA